MSASIWTPDSALSANNSIRFQAFVATPGQTSFTLTDFAYALGVDALLVFIDGLAQRVGVDFLEVDTTHFDLDTGVPAGTIVLAMGFVEIESGAAFAAAAAASAADALVSENNAAASEAAAAVQAGNAGASAVAAAASAAAALVSENNAAASEAQAAILAATIPVLSGAGDALKGIRANAAGLAYELYVSGTGDVFGPASAVDGQIAVYNGTTGKLIGTASSFGIIDVARKSVSNVFLATQFVQLTDDTSGGGPFFTLRRYSASPAASDNLGGLVYVGKDSGNNDTTYGYMQASIVDPTDGSEDGMLLLQTMIAGVLGTRLFIGAGLYANGVVGGDKGLGTFNFATIYENNVRVLTDNSLAAGIAAFLATPNSANLRAAMTDESGSGALLFANGALGTPASGVLTNCTGTAAGLTAGACSGNAATVTTITAAQVGAANAGLALGAVGTYVLATSGATAVNAGATTPGSGLTACAADGSTTTATTFSGTWRCMGESQTGTTPGNVTVWLRIS